MFTPFLHTCPCLVHSHGYFVTAINTPTLSMLLSMYMPVRYTLTAWHRGCRHQPIRGGTHRPNALASTLARPLTVHSFNYRHIRGTMCDVAPLHMPTTQRTVHIHVWLWRKPVKAHVQHRSVNTVPGSVTQNRSRFLINMPR